MNQSIKQRKLCALLSTVFLAGCNGGSGTGATQCTTCNVFAIQSIAGTFGGAAGADALCQQAAIESNIPGTYKAFITESSARFACSTPFCVGVGNTSNDWVLHPNTLYQWYVNESPLFQTNAQAIFNSSLLSLTPAVYTESGNSLDIWTGFSTTLDWTSPLVTSESTQCGSWRNSSGHGIQGSFVPYSDSTQINFVSKALYILYSNHDDITGCSHKRSVTGLLCVQQ